MKTFKQYLQENTEDNIHSFLRKYNYSHTSQIYQFMQLILKKDDIKIHAIFKHLNGFYAGYLILYYGVLHTGELYRIAYDKSGYSKNAMGYIVRDSGSTIYDIIKNNLKTINFAWKIHHDIDVIFEMIYSDGKMKYDDYHRPEDELEQQEYAD